MASQECVAVLQRLLDECTLPCCFVLDADERAALTAAIDALQRQGEVVAYMTQSGLEMLADEGVAIVSSSRTEYINIPLYALPPQPPTGEQTP